MRPSQISDPASGFATAKGYETQHGGAASLAPTPVLGGGKTPLVGDAKARSPALITMLSLPPSSCRMATTSF